MKKKLLLSVSVRCGAVDLHHLSGLLRKELQMELHGILFKTDEKGEPDPEIRVSYGRPSEVPFRRAPQPRPVASTNSWPPAAHTAARLGKHVYFVFDALERLGQAKPKELIQYLFAAGHRFDQADSYLSRRKPAGEVETLPDGSCRLTARGREVLRELRLRYNRAA